MPGDQYTHVIDKVEGHCCGRTATGIYMIAYMKPVSQNGKQKVSAP